MNGFAKAAGVPAIERRFVDVPAGTIHCASCGDGRVVLLLHQTPRSWDEFRDVLPLLGRSFRAIAIDTIGYGDSSRPPLEDDSIERWAAVAVQLLDALGVERAVVVGHHTGAAIAIELAAEHASRVEAVVLSAPPFVDAAWRASHTGAPAVDRVERRADGAHLAELWRIRQPWYPKGDVDLLERFVVDAIKAGPRASHGHVVVARYRMEERLPRVHCPALVVAPTDDPHAWPRAPRVAGAIPGSRIVEVPGGMVPLPDQMPQAFARLVEEFVGSLPA